MSKLFLAIVIFSIVLSDPLVKPENDFANCTNQRTSPFHLALFKVRNSDCRKDLIDAAKWLCSDYMFRREELDAIFTKLSMFNYPNYASDAAPILNKFLTARVRFVERIKEFNSNSWNLTIYSGYKKVEDPLSLEQWDNVRLRLTANPCVESYSLLHNCDPSEIFTNLIVSAKRNCRLNPVDFINYVYKYLDYAIQFDQKYTGSYKYGIEPTDLPNYAKNVWKKAESLNNEIGHFIDYDAQSILERSFIGLSSPKNCLDATGFSTLNLRVKIMIKNSHLLAIPEVCERAKILVKNLPPTILVLNSKNELAFDGECKVNDGDVIRFFNFNHDKKVKQRKIYIYHILHLDKNMQQFELESLNAFNTEKKDGFRYFSRCFGDITLVNSNLIKCESGNTIEIIKFVDFLAGESSPSGYISYNRSLVNLMLKIQNDPIYSAFSERESLKGLLKMYSVGQPSLAEVLKEEKNENSAKFVTWVVKMLGIQYLSTGDCIEELSKVLKQQLYIEGGKRCWFLNGSEKCTLKCGANVVFQRYFMLNNGKEWFHNCLLQ